MKAAATLRLLLAAAALATLAGCVIFMPTGSRYEYRYRVFQAHEPMPSAMEGPIANDVLAQRFTPPAQINAAMDDLTREGFKLWKIERVGDTSYHTFILRRPVSGRMRPMRAPTEFCGVYQVQPPGDETMFYALQPTYYGCTLVRFHGAEPPLIVDTKWDGDKLVGDDGPVHHVIVLTAGGFSIAHAEEHLLANRLDRKIYNARRVNTGKP